MSPSYQVMIKTLLQSHFPDASSEQILQAALSKDGSLGPAMLTVSCTDFDRNYAKIYRFERIDLPVHGTWYISVLIWAFNLSPTFVIFSIQVYTCFFRFTPNCIISVGSDCQWYCGFLFPISF